MSRLENYKRSTEVMGGVYCIDEYLPVAEAHDIMVAEDDTRLDEKLAVYDEKLAVYDEKLAVYDETVAQVKRISQKTYITATITGEYSSSEVSLHISRIIDEKKTSLGTISSITSALKKGLAPNVLIPVTGRIGKNPVIAMYYDGAGEWYVRYVPNIIDTTTLPDYYDVMLSECITNDYNCSCSCIVLMDTGT